MVFTFASYLLGWF